MAGCAAPPHRRFVQVAEARSAAERAVRDECAHLKAMLEQRETALLAQVAARYDRHSQMLALQCEHKETISGALKRQLDAWQRLTVLETSDDYAAARQQVEQDVRQAASELMIATDDGPINGVQPFSRVAVAKVMGVDATGDAIGALQLNSEN